MSHMAIFNVMMYTQHKCKSKLDVYFTGSPSVTPCFISIYIFFIYFQESLGLWNAAFKRPLYVHVSEINVGQTCTQM